MIPRTSLDAPSVRPCLYHAEFISGQRRSHPRVTSARDREALTTKTDQHELSRLLRYRLAVLEAALRRLDRLRRGQPRLYWHCRAVDRFTDGADARVLRALAFSVE